MRVRRVYLSGAIEHASDGGTGWREEIGRFLAGELGEEVYDPAADEKKDLTEEERRHFRRWKTEAPVRFRQVVRKIIAWDLGHIRTRSDYVLAFWDDFAARGGGTAAEITLAFELGKPVYLVLGMPLESASGWVIAAATEVFEDFDALRGFLLKQCGDRKVYDSRDNIPPPMSLIKTHLGWIEVICGSMFSGKSEELIRRLRRVIIAKQRVQIFKPVIDARYSDAEIVSHSEMRLPSISVASSAELMEKLDHRTEVVGVDEAQFFDDGIVVVCQRMADQGKRVIVAGLDKDYRGAPFGPIPTLMAVAEDVTKTLAICMRCGAPANNTQRLVESNELVVVGAQGLYEARCRRCFEPPGRN